MRRFLTVVAVGLCLAAQPVLAATPAPSPAPVSAAVPLLPNAPPPTLEYAFSVQATLAPPVEAGNLDGGRRRFIQVTGGAAYGPMLSGTVLGGGGDWQTIRPGGLTDVEAHYFIKAADGTVIEVTNVGVRVASAEVTDKIARGEAVDPSAYYFRTTTRFGVVDGPLGWMRRAVFVARGIRKPDSVVIDFYVVR
ncbi:DUF3237 family protein [Novosphingobium sp. FSY-8]|uniref:UPF0311 protein GTZ99_05670 n=2 Tax=Novosphingobium ovatum TaxID=1908523 RepID=A0ABW9XBZ6_9SPHN|nr:DUF3237 family protein [Novosphingobium ovatum]